MIVYDDVFLEHRMPGHPERPERLTAITGRLRADPGASALAWETASDVEDALLDGTHDPRHVRAIEAIARSGGAWIDQDTYCLASSYAVARQAAGATVRAAAAVVGGEVRSAVALVRPPGHHATRERAMGFCLFNNIAVATAAARRAGAERVAIIDIDVHHGNGTQAIFYEDPAVLYTSLHQYPFYPGTGAADETGRGAGLGATVNVPLPAGTAGDEWMAAFDARVAPAVQRHRPHLVLVSAGFDAHAADPLAELALETETYREAARRIAALAGDAGAGSVWVLEGGYDLTALADSVHACISVLPRSAL